MPEHQALVRKIARSQILSDYEIAFVNASGLPMRFQPVENAPGEGLPLSHHPAANAFCALLSNTEAGCKMCGEVERKLLTPEGPQVRTEECVAGLLDTAVPVLVGGRVAGYLRTGQVALAGPQPRRFSRVARTLLGLGLQSDLKQMEAAWLGSKVLSPAQHDAFVHLLKVFASHIGLAAEQFLSESAEAESPVVQKAHSFIEAHLEGELRVGDVAAVVNLSVFYFCKVFKKATGKTFTQYVSEVRVEKAKKLLQNRRLRISEVAFEAGFQSITHFNRTFRKLTGQSPSVFRELRWQAEGGGAAGRLN